MSSSPAPVRTPPLPRCLHKPPDSCQVLPDSGQWQRGAFESDRNCSVYALLSTSAWPPSI